MPTNLGLRVVSYYPASVLVLRRGQAELDAAGRAGPPLQSIPEGVVPVQSCLKILSGALAAATLAMPVSAQQGYVYTSDNVAAGETMTSQISVWGSHIKMELVMGDQITASMSFDGDVMIASDGHQYFEITPETAQQLAGAMAGAQGMMAQAMEQARANMSEEELEELRKMGVPGLEDMGQGGARPESSRVGSTGSETTPVGSCTVYRYEFPDGTPDQELCLADEPILGFQASREAFEGLSEFLQPLQDAMAGSSMAGMERNPFERMSEMESMPIKGVQYSGGQVVSEWTITGAREADLGPADFGPPEGLPRAELPIGG